jgi:hypothetical protein
MLDLLQLLEAHYTSAGNPPRGCCAAADCSALHHNGQQLSGRRSSCAHTLAVSFVNPALIWRPAALLHLGEDALT